jgi:hypothetical protein
VVGLLTAVPVTVFVVEYLIKSPEQRALPELQMEHDPFPDDHEEPYPIGIADIRPC